MSANRILKGCLQVGRVLLETGETTAVVEEAVRRTGLAWGADSLEVSVSPARIFLSVEHQGDQATGLKRVYRTGVRLSLVAEVLDLVHRLEQNHGLAADGFESELEAIEKRPRQHGTWWTALAVGAGCGGFGILLGGGLDDFLVIWLTASLAQALRHQLLQTRLGSFLTTAVIAGSGSTLAWWLSGEDFRVAAAASILMLVPGVPLVSGAADLFRGDSSAGLARISNAVVTILMAGAGVWGAVLLVGLSSSLTGPKFSGAQIPWLGALMGGLAAAGFAVLFDVPRKYIAGTALTGVLAITARTLALTFGLPPEVANFFAGITLGLAAETLARQSRTPSSIFSIPGYIPLIPGTLFIGGILQLVSRGYLEGLSLLVRALLILISVALGMGCVHVLYAQKHRGIA